VAKSRSLPFGESKARDGEVIMITLIIEK